ncbi:hypothetical protein EV561_1542 [Rhizobium sp. BK376]|nr:hypothetical protein EV561_1542 [Rhizobium sp. BK376]
MLYSSQLPASGNIEAYCPRLSTIDVGRPAAIVGFSTCSFLTLKELEHGWGADANRIRIGDQDITLKQSVTAFKPGDKVSLALHPEAGSLAESAKDDASLTREVMSVHFLGSVTRACMTVAGNTVPSTCSTIRAVTLRFQASDLLPLP